MKNRKETNTGKIITKVGKAILLLLFVLTLISATRGIFRLTGSGDRVNDARKRLDEVKAEQEKLKRELSKIDNTFYQEKQARDKLGLAKEGEIVVILPDETMLRRLSPRRPEKVEADEDIANWQKWAKLFFEI